MLMQIKRPNEFCLEKTGNDQLFVETRERQCDQMTLRR